MPHLLQKDGPLYAICMDPVTSTIYINQKLKAWTYTSYRETRCEEGEGGKGRGLTLLCDHRDVWKIYLDQGQYERAKQFAEVS